MLDAGDHIRLETFHFARQFDVIDPREQRLKHQAQLEPREMRAGAEMLALAERDMLVRRAPDIETVRIDEGRLVPISGRHPERQPIALANLLTAQFSVARGNPRDMSNGAGPAQ